MTRPNKILLVVLIIQIAVVILVGMKKQPTSVGVTAEIFPELEIDKITRIDLLGASRDGEPRPQVSLSREGGSWGLPNADGFPADQAKVKDLLEKIKELRARGPVVTAARHHSRLKLADDNYEKSVTVQADGNEIAFLVGSPSGTRGVHLRKKGEDAVFPVTGLKAWEIGDQASQWIDRNFFKHEPNQIWSIVVENEKGRFELSRDEGDDWRLEGHDAPLDRSARESLVRRAASLQLDNPLGKTVLAAYGFDDPTAKVTIVVGPATAEGGRPDETTTASFTVGSKTTEKDRYFVRTSTSPFIVEAAGWSLKELIEGTAEDLIADPDEEAPEAEASFPEGFPQGALFPQ